MSLHSAADDTRSRALGIHVEGPFVAQARRGAISEELIRPISAEYLDRMLSLSREKYPHHDIRARAPGAPSGWPNVSRTSTSSRLSGIRPRHSRRWAPLIPSPP